MPAPDQPSETPAFYPDQYRRFASPLSAEIRRQVYGADLGQQGWRTLDEQEEIVGIVAARAPCRVLDVACGSGGPSLALVARVECEVVGLDVEEAAVGWARHEAARLGLLRRARFEAHDCDRPLPFDSETFDVVVCIDAVLHLADRVAALAEWARVLREGGRLVLADSAVLTGPISSREIALRASQGPVSFVPPGANERFLEAAGFAVTRRADRSEAAASLARRWFEVRRRFAPEIEAEEGTEFFARRQRFLAIAADLAASRRLSRDFYVAEKQSSSDPSRDRRTPGAGGMAETAPFG